VRTFILGLDGLSWRVLDPYITRGLLPTFRRLRDEGASGVLESTIPPITPPAWTSILTGKNPGKHGLWNFVHPRRTANGYAFDLQTRFDYDARPLWRLLGALGTRGVFYNVPFAYPPDTQVGDSILISGFMTPDSTVPFTQPPHVAAELRAAGYDQAFEVPHDPAAAARLTTLKLGTAVHLAAMYDWQVFFTVIDEPDRLQHACWSEIVHFEPGCVEYFRALDRGVAEVLGLLRSDDRLWIVSDHGFRSASTALCINDYLFQEGLLAVKEPRRLWRRAAYAHSVDAVRAVPLGAALLARLRSEGAFDPQEAGQHGADIPIDWEATSAFGMLSSGGCAVYSTRDDANVHARLAATVGRICDESGGKCRAFRRDELFAGPYAASLPDWIIMADEPLTFLATMHGKRRRRLQPGGVHEREGVVMVHGRGVPKVEVRLGVCDVLPTVLHGLQLPVPNDVDGAVIQGLGGSQPKQLWDPDTGAIYEERTSEPSRLRNRLRGL
jgi:predicted AlkP superfamily phosphohydrolase/phosphomutase